MAKPLALVLGAATVLVASSVLFQSVSAEGARPADQPPANQDEIVVTGRIGDLRRQLWSAEQSVFDRFNDINSNDGFDIHCTWEPKVGSRIVGRVCRSNVWRAEEANYGAALLQELRNESRLPPAVYLAEQSRMQARLFDEMKRLSTEDEQLGAAFTHLGKAQQAYAMGAGLADDWSQSFELPAGAEGLPFAANAALEVRMGHDAWTHPLGGRTFTIGPVTGEIRKLGVKCNEGSERLDYRAGVEWTLPADWTACSLRVVAPRDTSFALYELPTSAAGHDATK